MCSENDVVVVVVWQSVASTGRMSGASHSSFTCDTTARYVRHKQLTGFAADVEAVFLNDVLLPATPLHTVQIAGLPFWSRFFCEFENGVCSTVFLHTRQTPGEAGLALGGLFGGLLLAWRWGVWWVFVVV